QAQEDAILALQIDETIMDERAGDVGGALGDAPLLELAAGVDKSGGPLLEGDDGQAAAGRHDELVGGGDGRTDDAMVALVAAARVEIAQTPHLPAVLEHVARGVVAAED